jgi:hypothetical protein
MSRNQTPPAVHQAPQAGPEMQTFHGTILDLGIADKSQVELFAAVGRTKAPFQGVVDWPHLNTLVQERSLSLLDSDGEEAWKAAGGVYGEDSKPTFSAPSSNTGSSRRSPTAPVGLFGPMLRLPLGLSALCR